MNQMNCLALAAISLLLGAGVAARQDVFSETWVHPGGKAGGVIVTLACEPVSGASITFADRKRTQLVTPDRTGRFIVELPAGKYQVSVSIPGRGLVEAEELVLDPAKNGTLRLYIATGVEVIHDGCFGPDVEALLIPAVRGVTSDKLMERPPTSKP